MAKAPRLAKEEEIGRDQRMGSVDFSDQTCVIILLIIVLYVRPLERTR